MKELQVVNFGQAQRLRAAGFNWWTDFYWSDTNSPELCHAVVALGECEFIPAPSTALALKWVRDVKNMIGFVDRNAAGYYWNISKNDNGTSISDSFCDDYATYEEAEGALLNELLNVLKIKN